MKLAAKIVASILHPATLILPTVFLIVYKSIGQYQAAFTWTFISFIFTGIVAAFVLYGVKKGFFSDVDVSIKKQRIILYPFVVVITLLFIGVIYIFNGPPLLIVAGILFVAALIILDLVNIRIKASIHVASISAMATGVYFLYGGVTSAVFLLIPLVAWARIVEKRHTLPETIVGGVCGIGLTVIAIIVVQFIVNGY